MDHWTNEMSARERIGAIATTVSQPRSVNWISEEAETGWETAESHLGFLVESGVLQKVDGDGATRYAPDPTRAYLDHVAELVADHSRGELRDELEAIASEIEAWEETYDVESFKELEVSLGSEGLSADEVRDRRRVLRYWEENDDYRDLLTNALTLYDDLADLTESGGKSHSQHGHAD